MIISASRRRIARSKVARLALVERLEGRELLASTITEYPGLTAGAFPNGIVEGADGNLWFTEVNGNRIGRISPTGVVAEFPTLAPSVSPTLIAAGPDGNLWYTDGKADLIGRITPTGLVTNFPVPTALANPTGIAAGPDGALWFTEQDTATIGRITTAGVITEFATTTPASGPNSIAAGPDGNLWFTESPVNKIGRITPAGVITEFAIAQSNVGPTTITAGPDGALWFTEFIADDAGVNRIGRISTAGVVTEFPIPTLSARPVGIALGADSNLYFTEFGGNKIGRITPAGVITEFPVPTAAAGLAEIAPGPNNTIWFSESAADQIGTFSITPFFTGETFLSPPIAEGQPFSAPILNFTFSDPTAVAAGFTATVNYGDGSPIVTVPASAITGSAGSFSLVGTHTYIHEGSYPTTIVLTGPGGASATVVGTLVVPDAPLSSAGRAIVATVNQPFTGVFATFTDAGPPEAPGSYTATIQFGDGHSGPGVVQSLVVGGVTTFEVVGTNTYTSLTPTGSPLATSVTIVSAGGSRTTATGTATVDGPALNVVADDISGVAATPLTNVPVATFYSLNTPTPSTSYSATIEWGDGTSSAGTIVNGPVNYNVLGSHTYSLAGSYAVRTTITGPGTVVIVASTASIADSTITGTANNQTVNAGQTTAYLPLATFTHPGGEDVGSFTATINYGDGTPVALGEVFATPTGFSVLGSHLYATQGLFFGTVNLRSAGGSVSTVRIQTTSISPTISAAPITVVESTRLSNALLATITTTAPGANPIAADTYAATINWGDGTPPTIASLTTVGTGTGSSIEVRGSHIYAESGTYTRTITLSDPGAPTLETQSSAITVTDVPIVLTAALDPASDSGQSNADFITNVTTPTYYGTSEPGSIVELFLTTAPATPRLLGQTVADASGSWRITTTPLPDGVQSIVATAIDRNGVTRAATATPPLTIDTVGPRVTEVFFNRLTGQVLLAFQDDRSGLNQRSIVDGANYSLTGRSLVRGNPGPRHLLATSIVATPGALATDSELVTITINGGRQIRGGFYQFLARSGGIRDAAGNALDGEFYGYLPSGNNAPGGDFSAELDAIHNVIYSPLPVPNGFATPNVPPGTPAPSFIISNGNIVASAARAKALAAAKAQAKAKVVAPTKVHPKATAAVAKHR